jgi:hypothetical protein
MLTTDTGHFIFGGGGGKGRHEIDEYRIFTIVILINMY